MSDADRLGVFLGDARAADGAVVSGWRFELASSETVRLGIRNSEFGGPYEGAGVALRLAASLDLHWSDGLLTRATLDRRAINDPAAQLAEWRATAVTPRDGRLPPLAGPACIPHVDVYDQDIAAAVSSDSAELLRVTAALREATTQAGALRTDAVVRATLGRRAVATSLGFRVDWQDTHIAITVWVDELGGGSYERRVLPSLDQVAGLGDEAATLAGQLRRTAALPVGACGVLFAPSAVEQLVGRFLLTNLVGRTIRDGRSFFSRADLDAHRRIAQDGFVLSIDTTQPYEPATAPCSSEGVPAGHVDLIADGRLMAPIVELEAAAELGYPPTPRPRGRPHAVLSTTNPPISWDSALALLGTGVIVRDLPGLHTQATRRGAYALVTPDAQVVEGGRAGGRCAVRLAGNAIDHVSQPSSRLVRAPGGSGLGLLVLSGVTLLPA